MEILKIADVFGDLPELETPRLRLRKLKAEDAPEMFEYASDPEVARDVTWEAHRTMEDSRGFLNSVVQKYAKKETSEWGLVLKETGKLVGTCGFVWWRPEHARAEFGYALSRKYWGRGLMTEAAAAVIAFAFGRMKLHRLEARCITTNTGSEKVMLKNGMKYEGLLRDVVYEKGGFKSLKLYSLLKDEYRGGV
ncbi:MAG: GNAT family N-acetyltransferase [Elusimicrobiales bacterium]|nr:GNAT family N-acetyltransferase [Elusimicrobiales bacterium]